MYNERRRDPPSDNTADTDTTGGAAAKKGGGCRRVLAWGLLICGLLVLIGGGGVAVWANFTAQPSAFWTCQSADREKASADVLFDDLKKRGLAFKSLNDQANLPAADRKAIDDFTSRLKISDDWQGACASDLSYRRRWRNIFLGVAVIGFFGTLLGYLLKR